MNKELDNEIKVIVNGKERNIKLNEEGSLKEGEYLYKENDKWYIHKINFKTIPITKEDYEKEIEKLNKELSYYKTHSEEQRQELARLLKQQSDNIKHKKYTKKEINRLNNIIDELEKYLEERIKSVPETMTEVYEDTNILNRLKTLKEGKNES